MPVTGLYFIPFTSATVHYPLLDALIARFQAAYQDAAFVGRWSLEHRLLRDAQSAFGLIGGGAGAGGSSGADTDGDGGGDGGDDAALFDQQPRHMHFLTLSSYPAQAFICVSAPPRRYIEEAAEAIEVPAPVGAAAAAAATAAADAAAAAATASAAVPQQQRAGSPQEGTPSTASGPDSVVAGSAAGAGTPGTEAAADEVEEEEEPPTVIAEASPDDEAQLLLQQEMLFKLHLRKHKEQEQQKQREEAEAARKAALLAEQQRLKEEEEQRKLLEQQQMLLASASQRQQLQLQRQQQETATAGGSEASGSPGVAAAYSPTAQSEQERLQQEQEQEQARQAQAARETARALAARPMVMFTVDKPSSAAWYSMVLRAAKPLWVPRHTVAVPAVNSAVFRVGDFQVRIGEVKQTAPQTRTRGTIVEIEYTDPSVRHRRRRQPRRHTQHGDGGAASDTTDSEMRDDPLLEESSDAESEGSFGVFEETGSGHGASSAGPTNIDGTDDGDGSLAAGAIEPVTDPARQPRLRASKAPTSLSILTQEDWEIGEVLIREFWKRFAVPNAREYIRVKDVGLESSLARERGVARLTATTDAPGGTTKAAGLDGVAGADLARQYMEAFRFNR